MKHIPDIITTLRLLGAVFLLPSDPASVVFWVIYGLCGVSDMADGYLARRLHAESKFGAVLDSVADICFVVFCAIRLIPVLQIPTWLWIWAGVIVLIKLVNQISALVVCKGFRFKVEFQSWLRENAGLTFRDAVEAYPSIKKR